MTQLRNQTLPAVAPTGGRGGSVAVAALVAEVERVVRVAARRGWRSYDPYDLLLSPLLAPLQSRSALAARIAVQAGKRSGIAPRVLLGVRPHREAKTFSDFLSAAVLLQRCGYGWAGEHVPPLVSHLLDEAIPTVHGTGWGLNFPCTTRYINVPARTPNLYTTAGAVHALLDAFDLNGSQQLLHPVRTALGFVLEDLGYAQRGGLLWFQYWQTVKAEVVNVQAMAASVLARAGRTLGDERLSLLADEAARTVAASQHDGGFWLYEEENARFVDGFHTGFILQGLAEYRRYRGEQAGEIESAFEQGKAYFQRHLLTDDDLPRYYADGKPSTMGQNAAQCIQTLVVCADGPADVARALRVWRRVDRRARFDAGLLSSGRSRGRLLAGFPDLRLTLGPLVLARAYLIRALQALAAEAA